MPQPKLAIVIPVYSGVKQLKRCLSALQKSHYQDYSIIIVDHGETDNISQIVAANSQRTICLRGSPALWWTGATNLGISRALDNNNQLIMLLNHDCFVRPDTISQLLSSIVPGDSAIIAPVQNYLQTGKRILKSYSCMLLGFPTLILPSIWPGTKKKKALTKTDLIIGGRGAIIPASIFITIGIFDEKSFPHYGADHDFYYRCKNNNVSLYINQNAVVDIEDSSKSAASQIKRLTFVEFFMTLVDRKSHRNIHDLRSLYRKHYPIKYLYLIGLGLNIFRYFLVYLWVRIAYKL